MIQYLSMLALKKKGEVTFYLFSTADWFDWCTCITAKYFYSGSALKTKIEDALQKKWIICSESVEVWKNKTRVKTAKSWTAKHWK